MLSLQSRHRKVRTEGTGEGLGDMMFQLRTQPDVPPLTRQATLELFGFHVNNNIGRSTASSVTYNNQFPYQKIPPCYPFVKWAGGKTQLLPQLSARVPAKFDRYFEPFLGGGALFFYLMSNKNKRFTAFISDINSELMNSYVVIKENVDKLIILLTQHENEYNKASEREEKEKYYYQLRNDYNLNCPDRIERAAQLITLNRTCFNGLYRVNPKGKFNVPLGKYKNPTICNSSNLRNVSNVLCNPEVTIKACDYKEALLENAKEGDFIYLDPPYIPVSSTAYFTNYTKYEFSPDDQKNLASVFRKLDERGCKVMLTNSDTPSARELYSDYAKYNERVDSKRSINSKGSKREGHTDLIIRNYS
jgi:DNA adenine methylase